MTLEGTRPEEIASACAELKKRGAFPERIARGLAANDGDAMRAAVKHLIDAGRVEGLRELIARFRAKSDYGVFARVMSAHLHRAAGAFEAGLGDVEELMTLFPDRAGAHWWVLRAHCLEGLGRGEEAVAALREGAERFPGVDLPGIILANLLSRLRRPQEAVEVWRDLIARFPEPAPEWFAGLATSLKAVGRREEALAALEEAGARFGETSGGLALAAELAEERGQWARALGLWSDYAQRLSGPDEVEAALGVARTLFRLDRVDEADEALDRLIARRPGQPLALREQGLMALELGEAERARDLHLRLMQRFAGKARPEWLAALARAHNDLMDYEAGEAALGELERRFPDSPAAAHERLRLAKDLDAGQDELTRLVEAALRKFPGDAALRANWAWLRLGLGRVEEAERIVLALEAEGAAGHALFARLRLEADRADEADARAYIERYAEGRDWDAADAASAADFLIAQRAPWAFDLASRILEPLAERFAGHMRLRILRIRALIARREDAAAADLIAAIPARCRRREVLEFRAWAAARAGRQAEAKALWRDILAANPFPAVRGPALNLTRLTPEGRVPPDGGVTAYIAFRNEAGQIPHFLAHHRRLGVRRFVFFDHGSTDESRALLLGEPDVILYDAPDSYQASSSGRRWIHDIVAREGARGWGLQLDVDEHLIYPGWETVPIDRFVAYLDLRGYEGVRGYMLDVFPPRLAGADGRPAPFAEHRWFDEDYVLYGLERPPYLSPSGGARARLFAAKEYLHKAPLWRLGAGMLLSTHETTALAFADVSCALVHYKIMNVALRGPPAAGEAGEVAEVETDTGVDIRRRYSRYAARLAALWRADLVAPGVSREIGDSLAMAERGLMDISEDYRRFMRAP